MKSTETTFNIDKEKYRQIARDQGIPAALTALHRDTEHWEWDTFEGNEGYKPTQFEALKSVREFSRELWEIATVTPEKKF